MSEEKFDLMFSGELVPGYELAQVKKNIQLLFRIDAAKTEILFSGRAIALKKGLDAETANKYRVAIKKAGARVAVSTSEANAAKPQPATAEKTRPTVPPDVPVAPGFSGDRAVQSPAQPVPRAPMEVPKYEIADAGADMLPLEYRLPLPEVDIDVSALSVAPQEGNLVREGEIARPKVTPVNVPDMEVAPVGSDVLKPEERPKVSPVEVDVSGLSVAQVGERLAPQRKPAPAAPNVDHIKLKD